MWTVILKQKLSERRSSGTESAERSTSSPVYCKSIRGLGPSHTTLGWKASERCSSQGSLVILPHLTWMFVEGWEEKLECKVRIFFKKNTKSPTLMTKTTYRLLCFHFWSMSCSANFSIHGRWRKKCCKLCLSYFNFYSWKLDIPIWDVTISYWMQCLWDYASAMLNNMWCYIKK